MDNAEAIRVIRSNWPPSSYTMLREALELSIKHLEASALAKQSASPTNAMVPCPTCGGACSVYSGNEGTNSFEPVTPYRAQHQ